jgi:hypothetical protein
MNRRTTFSLTIMVLASLAAALSPSTAFAQQKQQISLKVPAENSKFIVSQNIEVGDVPNHIVRLFEVQARLPSNTPSINGLKLVELWQRGITELTEGNGSATKYFMFAMDNGDKFFVRAATVVQNVSGKITATSAGRIFGGTGRLAGNRSCGCPRTL